MLHASTRKLIDRLAEMTELGKLDWTEGEDGRLTYSTEGYSVSLTDAPNELIITSKDGKQLEHATGEELAATPGEDGGTYADLVGLMTKEAARVARGTEAAISTLLAGMEPAEQPNATDETDVRSDLPEDPVDETTGLATVLSDADTPEDHAENAQNSTDPADSDEESDAMAAVTATPQIQASDAENEAEETETETVVTEAVARLADEVNQREDNDSALGAAAASAVGAVALAAGLDPTRDLDASSEAKSETAPERAVDTQMSAAEEEPAAAPASAVADAEPAPAVEAAGDTLQSNDTPAYIPFGLEPELPAETASEAVSEVSASAAPQGEPATEIVASETVPEDLVEAAAEQEASMPSLVLSDTSEPVIPDSHSANETATPGASGLTDPVAAPALEPEPEPSAEPTESTSTPAKTPEPQTYSLSGIGAGFGLGALSAKTEASGVPGPSPSAAGNPEKIVIDATDDILPEIEGNINLPLIEKATAAVKEASAETPEQAPDEASESDILKPRTRFNPWD